VRQGFSYMSNYDISTLAPSGYKITVTEYTLFALRIISPSLLIFLLTSKSHTILVPLENFIEWHWNKKMLKTILFLSQRQTKTFSDMYSKKNKGISFSQEIQYTSPYYLSISETALFTLRINCMFHKTLVYPCV